MRVAHPGERGAVVGDDPVGAQLSHEPLVATAADPGDRRRAEVAGQLDRRHPDRTGGADDQHATPGDVGLVAQVVQRGGASEQHGRGVGVAHRVGDPHAPPHGHGGELGVRPHPGAGHRRDSGAEGRTTLGALLDDTGRRDSEHRASRTPQAERDAGRRAESGREARTPDPGVAGVDRRDAHPDQDVTVAEPGRLDLAHLHDLGRTVGPHHRSAHDHSLTPVRTDERDASLTPVSQTRGSDDRARRAHP
ncbi:hypothetical protein GCM10027425_25770 [Alteromonas gracilis]